MRTQPIRVKDSKGRGEGLESVTLKVTAILISDQILTPKHNPNYSPIPNPNANPSPKANPNPKPKPRPGVILKSWRSWHGITNLSSSSQEAEAGQLLLVLVVCVPIWDT